MSLSSADYTSALNVVAAERHMRACLVNSTLQNNNNNNNNNNSFHNCYTQITNCNNKAPLPMMDNWKMTNYNSNSGLNHSSSSNCSSSSSRREKLSVVIPTEHKSLMTPNVIADTATAAQHMFGCSFVQLSGQEAVSLFTGLPSCTPTSADKLPLSANFTSINPFFWGVTGAGAGAANQAKNQSGTNNNQGNSSATLMQNGQHQSQQLIEESQRCVKVMTDGGGPVMNHAQQQHHQLNLNNQHHLNLNQQASQNVIALSPFSLWPYSPEADRLFRFGLTQQQQQQINQLHQQHQQLQANMSPVQMGSSNSQQSVSVPITPTISESSSASSASSSRISQTSVKGHESHLSSRHKSPRKKVSTSMIETTTNKHPNHNPNRTNETTSNGKVMSASCKRVEADKEPDQGDADIDNINYAISSSDKNINNNSNNNKSDDADEADDADGDDDDDDDDDDNSININDVNYDKQTNLTLSTTSTLTVNDEASSRNNSQNNSSNGATIRKQSVNNQQHSNSSTSTTTTATDLQQQQFLSQISNNHDYTIKCLQQIHSSESQNASHSANPLTVQPYSLNPNPNYSVPNRLPCLPGQSAFEAAIGAPATVLEQSQQLQTTTTTTTTSTTSNNNNNTSSLATLDQHQSTSSSLNSNHNNNNLLINNNNNNNEKRLSTSNAPANQQQLIYESIQHQPFRHQLYQFATDQHAHHINNQNPNQQLIQNEQHSINVGPHVPPAATLLVASTNSGAIPAYALTMPNRPQQFYITTTPANPVATSGQNNNNNNNHLSAQLIGRQQQESGEFYHHHQQQLHQQQQQLYSTVPTIRIEPSTSNQLHPPTATAVVSKQQAGNSPLRPLDSPTSVQVQTSPPQAQSKASTKSEGRQNQSMSSQNTTGAKTKPTKQNKTQSNTVGPAETAGHNNANNEPSQPPDVPKKKSKGGRKKKLVSAEEMIARKTRSKERNRVAAKRCRQKRKVFFGELNLQIEKLQEENKTLKNKLAVLSRHHEMCTI